MTVRENIRYINEYMFIEQLRYPDNLIFLNEIPEEMMEFYIRKLILQPSSKIPSSTAPHPCSARA